MNILVVNEAGCFAPGVVALAKALSFKHRVVIVAPLHPQLNSGHRLTTSNFPLRIRQYFVLNKIKIFSVNGTPCDCVTLALDKLLLSKPDLIISGICDRHNKGEYVYSSGIVSAAIEGTIQGIPSIAVSARVREDDDEKNFEAVANSFAKLLPKFVEKIKPGMTLNVNYPERFTNKIMCTPITTDMCDNKYECEVNPFGNTFYWLKVPVLGYPLSALDQKGDIYWLKKNFITVTPLKLNLTAHDAISIVEKGGIAL